MSRQLRPADAVHVAAFQAANHLVVARSFLIRMKTAVSSIVVCCALLLSPATRAEIYEAIVDRKGANQEGKRYSPPVEIIALDASAEAALRSKCGGDIANLPELAADKHQPRPWYPFEMRRNREQATVQCVVQVSPNGRVEKIYRIGADSDLFYTECARALSQWKLPAQKETSLYRVTFRAGMTKG